MKYKAVIWDLDGTLLDTLQDLASAVNHSLEAFGLPLRSVEEVRTFVGNGIRKLIDRSVPAGTDPATADGVFGEFRTYYAAHCSDTTAPYEGIPGLLADLARAGVMMAIVSNKAVFAVQDLTRAANLIRNNTYDAFNPLMATAIVYLGLVVLMTHLLGKLEHKLRKSDVR